MSRDYQDVELDAAGLADECATLAEDAGDALYGLPAAARARHAPGLLAARDLLLAAARGLGLGLGADDGVPNASADGAGGCGGK